METVHGEWQRCEPNDPERCQSSGLGGQCPYKVVNGQKYCPRHSAISDSIAAKQAANRYRLQQYQQRVEELTVDDSIKNLRAEIGISRMVLEEIIVRCKGPNDIINYSGKISDLVMKIQVLIRTCHRLEVAMGLMLDRDKVILIGQGVVDIVSKHVSDQSILDKLGDELVEMILKTSQPG